MQVVFFSNTWYTHNKALVVETYILHNKALFIDPHSCNLQWDCLQFFSSKSRYNGVRQTNRATWLVHRHHMLYWGQHTYKLFHWVFIMLTKLYIFKSTHILTNITRLYEMYIKQWNNIKNIGIWKASIYIWMYLYVYK